MAINNPADLPYGGICAWALPPDEHCAALARAKLGSVLRALHFAPHTIENAQLAVSELATNAWLHTSGASPLQPSAVSELALWARLEPRPELVVTVFDLDRRVPPCPTGDDPLAEDGRGLMIVEAVTSGWGSHPSRSRLVPHPLAGKVVWMAIPLPANWPQPTRPLSPAVAAQRLTMNLAARGVPAARHSEATGISLVIAQGLNIWVTNTAFSWTSARCGKHRHPLIDLQETSERVVETLERIGCPASG